MGLAPPWVIAQHQQHQQVGPHHHLTPMQWDPSAMAAAAAAAGIGGARPPPAGGLGIPKPAQSAAVKSAAGGGPGGSGPGLTSQPLAGAPGREQLDTRTAAAAAGEAKGRYPTLRGEACING